MYLIKFEIGNGYQCGCCRETTSYGEVFDDFNEFIEVYKGEDDILIEEVIDFEHRPIGNNPSLVESLKQELKAAQEIFLETISLQREIKGVEILIALNEKWLASMDDEKYRREQELIRDRAVLASLKEKVK